ncbi:MAG: sigma-54-dependent transcriptional regulator [Candidatus Lokiarchaeia archaeon]
MAELKILPNILVVDDEINVIESFKRLLEDDYKVLTATNGEEALEKIEKENLDIVLLDIRMPEMDGIEVLRRIREMSENVDVIVVTAVSTMRTAIEAMKLGAYDYITKPFEEDEVIVSINKALEKRCLTREVSYLRSEIAKPVRFDNIIGTSERMRQVYEIVSEMTKNDATVLIHGESGTGKELFARAIHFNGLRKNKPFIAVDCASIPENLLESELFGHEKGAFTDATSQKLGRFELANQGTLFLDEIGNLKQDMQGKILRVLQEREIQRVGGVKTIKIDVRIISATNVDLKKAIKEGKFREDLYYRLNVVPIELPSLRERKEDIPLLVRYFLEIFNREFGKKIKDITPEAMEFLMNYRWPGNVRELRNVIERLVALTKEEVFSHKGLPLDILLTVKTEENNIGKEGMLLKGAREQFEKQFILGVLEKVNWNQGETAKILGIHRNTLMLKMQNLGIKKV